MHAQTSFAPARKIAGYLGLLIIALIIAGLFTVSFASGMAVLAGILVYFLFAWAFHIARAKVLWLLIPVFVIGLIILLSLVTKPPVAPHICAVASYRVVFIPQTPQVKSIKIQEFVTLNASVSFTPPADWTAAEVANQPGFSLPEVYATIKNRGFLLNEASFQSSVPCSNKTEVELDDFPLNSFYAAHNAQSLQRNPYVDTETITWSTTSTDIRFSFIPPPFQTLRSLLAPLIGAASMSQWLLGIMGLLGSVVFVPILKPILTETAKKVIQAKVTPPEAPPRETAKLIISGRGDEEDVEVKKKP